VKKPVKAWRIMKAEPFGLLVWFDPSTERPEIHSSEPLENPGVLVCCEGDDQRSFFDELHH